MTGDPFDDPPAESPTEFDWGSPRWRENEPGPGEVEHQRRSRIDDRPRQRGVIDEHGSVSPSSASGTPPANGPVFDAEPDAGDSVRHDERGPRQNEGDGSLE